MTIRHLWLSLICALHFASNSASAQSFTNGGFDNGLAGWTVVNTQNGVGAPGSVAHIDIDGAGPLAASFAASFQAGQAVFQTGVQRGVEMTQTLSLVAGTNYVASFDWSAQKFSGANASDGGVFSLIVDGAILAQGLAGSTGPALPRFGRVSVAFTPAASGPASVGVRITRAFTPAADLFQFVDNVTLVGPPAATVLGPLPLGVTTLSGTLSAGEVKWYSLTVPSVAGSIYLDIDTEGTTLAPSNDSEIALYNASGNRVAEDDDDGSGFLSVLTFGSTSPRLGGSGLLYDGRDGSLLAGTYFLAVGAFNSTFGATGWNAVSSSANSGNFRLRLVLGDVNEPTGACCTPLFGCLPIGAVACAFAGGAYFGDGSDCATTGCPNVLFDSGRGCQVTSNGNQTLTGFSSGSLPSVGFPQRWSAQAFTLSTPARVERLAVVGFVPAGSEFATLNYIVWRRVGANRPVDGDQWVSGAMPLPPAVVDPRVLGGGMNLYRLPVDFTLPAGDYYLTVYASDPITPGADANFAWCANAQLDSAHPFAPNTPIVISDAQGVFMWRSASMPSPGFERVTSSTLGVATNPGFGPVPQNPDYVYSASFAILGQVLPSCGGASSYCTAGTTAGGCVASISGSGIPSASAGAGFTISVDNVDGQRSGLIIYGLSGAIATPWGSGSSFLCVKSPTQRMSTMDSGGVAGQCNGSLVQDWNLYIAANPGALGAPFVGGETVWAQGWFRDPPSPKSTSLSDGLQFIVCP